MSIKTKFDQLVWQSWEEKFFQEEVEAYRNGTPEEPAEVIPQHELMTAKEVCAKKRWSMSKLKRNIKARKLAYIKEDRRLWFRRADVERYEEKRYIRAK
jgi:hypothetical protein